MSTPALVERVSIVIPSWNGRHLLESCLASLKELEYPREYRECIVFDNGSSDDTIDWLVRTESGVRILRSPQNLGFARACNLGVSAARSRWVCLLNNDVTVSPSLLQELLAAQARTGAVCIGARVLNADGSAVEFDGGTMNFYGHGAPYRHGIAASEVTDEREPRPTLFACGAAMLVEREAFLQAGGFDESYFAYFEDVDLGWRLWVLGFECVLAPAARVRHRGQASEAALGAGGRVRLLERNALLTVYKNYEPERGARIFTCALALLSERARLDAARSGACREGLLSALAVLPRAARTRASLAARRVRRDEQIMPLFGEPWRPVVAGAAYAARQAELVRCFGVERDLGEASAALERH